MATRLDGTHAEISVRDTGTGIRAAAQAWLFEPFFTTKEVGKGTGQGLLLVHSVIVGKHHGAVTFTTLVGQGTTFVLRLPIVGPPPHRSGPQVTRSFCFAVDLDALVVTLTAKRPAP